MIVLFSEKNCSKEFVVNQKKKSGHDFPNVVLLVVEVSSDDAIVYLLFFYFEVK